MTASVLQGLLDGLDFALLALGLVLVFRMNRFVNVAHAQLGVVSAMLLAKFVLSFGWGYWPSFVLAIAAGVGIAMVVEVVIIRPLQQRSALTLFIVSTGIAQILLALTYIDALRPDPQAVVTRGYPVPFHITHSVGGFVLRGQHVFTLIAAPLIAFGIAALLRYTTLGKAMRAAASNPDAARLAAVPVRRLSTAVWGLAGALSAITAVLQAPGQAVFTVQALGPGLLLRALAAAALVGFTSLGRAFAVGVLIGVGQGIVLGITHAGGVTEVIVFIAILAGLLVRQQAFTERRRSGATTAEARTTVNVVASIRNLPIVRYHRHALWAVTAFVVLVLPHLPPLRSHSDQFLLSEVAIYALVGVSLTILCGWSGQVSLGHFALVGLSAFAAARLADHGWTLGQLVIACTLLGAVVAVVLGIPTVRTRGIALAITTLGFAVISSEWLLRQPWLAGPPGTTTTPLRLPGIGPLRSQMSVYYAACAVLVLVLTSASALRATRGGRLLLAVRDNDAAAEAFGVSAARTRLTALAISGAIAGIAGVLWVAVWRTADVAQFTSDSSFVVLAVPAIGGLESLGGALIGAVFVFGVPFFTSDLIRAIFNNSLGFILFLSGVGLVMTQLQFPGGVAEASRRWWQGVLDRLEQEVAPGDAVAAPDPSNVPPVVATPSNVNQPDRSGDVVLEARDVLVRFGGITAVDHASLSIRADEIVGLIGANGAGKTTLFNAIAGVVPLDDGTVRALGRDITNEPPHRRAQLGVARSFQDARLFPGLTVTETIQVALAARYRTFAASSMVGAPWSVAVERACLTEANEIIDRFGLRRWADIPISRLSTGTRRVCDFAAQVATRPRVLLLDEPTAGIAQRDGEAFGQVIRAIRDDLGCSILVIEHDLPLLLGIADRLYAMESGRIIAEGAPIDVRNNPLVIASYLGTTPAAIERSGARTQPRRGRKETATR